ncbi:MAG: MarR family transcriptional regulator [Lachnospiraceae bacterium]|nr:MarR family transcriptional regulator [Lachnospiraceae bacterium]
MKLKQNETLREFDRMNRMMDEHIHEIAASVGLSDSAYDILKSILFLDDGCTQTDICRYSHLNKQTVNSSVKKLEKSGYISFERGVGRERRILLTEPGKQVIKEKVIPVVKAENEIFNKMSEGERSIIHDISQRYMTAIGEELAPII